MKNTVKRVLISMMALNLTFGGFTSTKALAEELSNTDSEQIQVEETSEYEEVQNDTFEEYETETVSDERIQDIKQRRQFLIGLGVNSRFQTKKFEVYENNGCLCNSILSVDDPITNVDSFGTHTDYYNHRFVNYYTYQGENLVHVTTCFDCYYSKVTEIDELPEGAHVVGKVPEKVKKENFEKAKQTVIYSNESEEKAEVAPVEEEIIVDNTEVENKVESEMFTDDVEESNEEIILDDSDDDALMMYILICTLIGTVTVGMILFMVNHVRNNKKNDR